MLKYRVVVVRPSAVFGAVPHPQTGWTSYEEASTLAADWAQYLVKGEAFNLERALVVLGRPLAVSVVDDFCVLGSKPDPFA